MKLFLSIFSLLLCFFLNTKIAKSAGDSARVTICNYSSAPCFGFEAYTYAIEHFDTNGNLVELNSFAFNGCQYILDTAIQHIYDQFFVYDSLQRQIQYSYYFYSSIDTSAQVTTTNYDSAGNVTGTLYQAGYIDSLQNSSYDSIAYDSANHNIFAIRELWNTVTLSWDTLYIQYQAFDSAGRNTQSDNYNFSTGWEIHNYFTYDVDSNLIVHVNSSGSNGVFDSTRKNMTYDSLHHVLLHLEEIWDTTTSAWIPTIRNVYIYNTTNTLDTIYYFTCLDSTCTDTLRITVYTVDTANHGRLVWDYQYDSLLHVFNFTGISIIYYDSLNQIIEEGSSEVGHCAGSQTYYYTYNADHQIIHMRHERYTCDYFYEDCDYFNLNQDSMLVKIFYPFGVCRGDTVSPVVTVAGGTPPYTYLWSPSNGVLNLNSESPQIIADTVIVYALQVIDSLGKIQTDSFTLNVDCFPTIIQEEKSQNIVLVFPNPFHDEATIQLDGLSGIKTCQLFNLNGSILQNIHGENRKYILRRAQLANGVYILKIVTEDGILIKKVLIQ